MKNSSMLLNMRVVLLMSITLSTIGLSQGIQGISDIYYDSNADRLHAFGVTTADYSSAYYYQLETQSTVSGGGQYVTASNYDFYNGGWSATEIEIEPSSDVNATYTAMSGHSATVTYTSVELGFWCTWECNYAMDIYGYSSVSGPSGWPVEVWSPPMVSVVIYTGYVYLGNTEKEFFGFIDCAYWCGELLAASERLAERAAAIALVAGQPGQPDAGHIQALQQAKNRVDNALAKVAKYCATYIGYGAAMAAAAAALAEAAPWLLLAL